MRNLLVGLSSLFLSGLAHASNFMPVAGNSYAKEVDSLYYLLLIASLISFVLLIGGMVWFCVAYRRKSDNDETPYISHNHTLEFLWSFIPFVIFVAVFAWGWKLFREARHMPKNAFEIHVKGVQWAWNFEYKSGKKTTGEFVVPVNTPIKLIMTSPDVLHSFFIPAFRIKQDVIPGRYTALWFEADEQGEFQVYCTEYCGEDHSRMLARLKVLSKSQFEEWLADDPMKEFEGLTMAERGKLMITKSACTACHNFESSESKIGPSLQGLFGKTREFAKASGAVANEDYIRESILYPQNKIVKGYESRKMTAYKGLISDEQVSWIIEYIKSNSVN